MNETKRLAGIICEMDNRLLTEDRLADIRYKLLDWFGCVIGAANSESAAKLVSLTETEEGHSSTLCFSGASTSLLNAAFLNGAVAHILECDDVHKTAITHPGVIAVTAALMSAEFRHKDFECLCLGVLAGYEVMIRLGNALNPSHYNFWHTTGTCGAFAAAAASGKVMGLSEEEMASAFGLAATMASGLVCEFGSEAKLVTVGNAVRAGIQASWLAAHGVTSSENVLERADGYAAAVSTSPDLDKMICPAEPQMDNAYYKLYASCGHTHSALDAVFSLKSKTDIDPAQIERIDVWTYTKASELVGAFSNEDAAKARFSLPYCIAAAIITDAVSVAQFEDPVLHSAEVAELAKKVKVLPDPAYDLEYPAKRTERVRITLRNRTCMEHAVDLPMGKPSFHILEEKFNSLARRSMMPDQVMKVKKMILEANSNTSAADMLLRLKGIWKDGQ